MMHALGGDELEHAIPVERCFDWENLALAELARGDPTPPRRTRAAPRSTPQRSGLQLPDGAGRAGPARRCCSPRATPPRRRARGRAAADGCRRRSARGCRPPSRAACSGGRWPRPASASGAIEVLREAERELDACGSLRVRDELRRELRKLGARAEPRGPATAEDSGRRLR